MASLTGQRLRFAVALIGVALTLVTSGCTGEDDGWTYSVEEVRTAFRGAGYPVVPIEPPPGIDLPAFEGAYLQPPSGGPPYVLVSSPAFVEESWDGFVKVGGDSDSLTMRRANVLFWSDGGMSRSARERARRAMDELPERGFETETLEAG